MIVDPPLLRCQWWLTLRLLQAFQYGRWVTFQQWEATLITERFGTQTALANAIGLQLTPFTRGVAVGTFNVMNLLRLARAAEASPSMVLRLAGKGQEADLIEELYGSGRDALNRLAARGRGVVGSDHGGAAGAAPVHDARLRSRRRRRRSSRWRP